MSFFRYSVFPLSLSWTADALWPLPSQFSIGNNQLVVTPGVDFFGISDQNLSDVQTLSDALDRYKRLTFPHPWVEHQSSPDNESEKIEIRRVGRRLVGRGISRNETSKDLALTGMVISVRDQSEEILQLDTDESYSLLIYESGGHGQILAETVYGALRALETFSQLVSFDFDSSTYRLDPNWGAPLFIKDFPRFRHRGLMIDSARHFLPVRTIKHAIDAMSYAKLNVLHWHLSDSQSFPMQFHSRPKLWQGSFSSFERYLQEEIIIIVEYARERGIRVIPEFDVPGHAASWCTGYPEVCPSNPSCRQPLNVARNDTFELIEDILSECVRSGSSGRSLFPDKFIHLGGDEVDINCWEKDLEISAWLASRRFTLDDGYAYFVKSVADIAIKQGRRPIQWSEVYDHFKRDLDPSTIVHVWKSITNVSEVAENGYDLIVNVGYTTGSWYLDNLDKAWDDIYMSDPCSTIAEDRPDLCAKVLGGHREMWGETVDTSDFDATVWPRLGSIAERLWSPRASTENITDALPRIVSFRCLLNERGIAAAPVGNANARMAPPEPGSCYN